MDIFNEIRRGVVDGTPKGWWIEKISMKPATISSPSGVYVYARSETHDMELAMPLDVFIKNKKMIRKIVADQARIAVENILAK